MTASATIFYCRPNVPDYPIRKAGRLLDGTTLRLLHNQVEEFRNAMPGVLGASKLFNAPAEMMMSNDWPDEWETAVHIAQKKHAQMAVYRIEHLATHKERATRLRQLADLGIPLHVHVEWPFGSDPDSLRAVADYTESLLSVRLGEFGRVVSEKRRSSLAKGLPVSGRPRNCQCGHPRTLREEPTEAEKARGKKWTMREVHEVDGVCLVEKCECRKFRATEKGEG